MRVALEDAGGAAALTVTNKGPLLPEEMRDAPVRVDDFGARGRPATGTPHLGLGLYIARLIAEFHGGTIAASNLASGDGVALGVRIPLAWK